MKRISKISVRGNLDLSRLDEFIGMNCVEINDRLGLGLSITSGKSFVRMMIDRMIDKCDIRFNSQDYQYKVIRVDQYGKAKNPSPFKNTDYHEILLESWETSEFRKLLLPTYVYFVVTHGTPETSILKGYVMHDFTEEEMESARRVWIDTRDKIRDGIYDQFLTDRDTGTFFFKCHASSVACQSDAPRSGKEINRSFWVSRNLISRIVSGVR